MNFYHAATIYFSVKKESIGYGFYTQVKFLEKIEEYSDNWKREAIVILFLEVAKEFLQLNFSQIEGERKYTFTMYRIPLSESKGAENYRRKIWEYLSILCKSDKYNPKVREVLAGYGDWIGQVSQTILQFDLSYIERILESSFPANDLRNCILADDLARVFSRLNISSKVLSKYLATGHLTLYILLKGPEYNHEGHVYLKRQLIEDFKNIPLRPLSFSCSGSLVPVYYDWIEFLDSLLPHFIGLAWIKHKNYVEEEIEYLKKRIEHEQIEEIFRG